MVFPFRCCCDSIDLCDCFRPNADHGPTLFASGYQKCDQIIPLPPCSDFPTDCAILATGGNPGGYDPVQIYSYFDPRKDLASYMDEPVDTSDDEESYFTNDERRAMFGDSPYTCDMGCRPEGIFPVENQNISVAQGWDEVASATLRLRARGWDKHGNGSVPSCNFKFVGKYAASYSQQLVSPAVDEDPYKVFAGETGTKYFSAVSGPECGSNGWTTYEFPLELSNGGDFPRHPVIWYGLSPGSKPGPPGGGFRLNIDTWPDGFGSPEGIKEAVLQISALEICLTGCQYDISTGNPFNLPECDCVARGDCPGPYP